MIDARGHSIRGGVGDILEHIARYERRLPAIEQLRTLWVRDGLIGQAARTCGGNNFIRWQTDVEADCGVVVWMLLADLHDRPH